MERKSETTATRDETYDLISVCYHALEAADICEQYRRDAEQAGSQELVEFFDEVILQNRDIAKQAKRLLAEHLESEESVEATSEVGEQGVPASPH